MVNDQPLFHTDGDLPAPQIAHRPVIFVFGSNTAGRHGAGAAKVAAERFGARYGVGVGLQGMSYAIPTKRPMAGPIAPGARPALVTLPLSAIEMYVQEFIAYAQGRSDRTFFVSRIGCGLAGYEDRQVAPLFRDAPENCSFARQWAPFLISRPGLRRPEDPFSGRQDVQDVREAREMGSDQDPYMRQPNSGYSTQR